MNFTKSLSLLLIAGLATGIVASDNDTKKSELQKEINTKYYNRIQDDNTRTGNTTLNQT